MFAIGILPYLTNIAMRNRNLVPYRKRLLAAAEGRVLEIGIGSGLNLPFYGPNVTEVVGLEPSQRLLAMARRNSRDSSVKVTFLEGSAELIPLEKGTVDTVVMTWTLCSIPKALRALEEIRRVLKPGGQLLFVEHGRAPDGGVRKWQDWLTPLWKRWSGGCHLNRPIRILIESAGFRITGLEAGYAQRGLRPLSFMYEGRAQPLTQPS